MTPGSGADGLSAEGLVCSLGNRTLFNGLSLAVSPGQWLALTGENGAGKSTLLRILAGLLRPAAGTLHWQGRPMRAGDPDWHAQVLYQGHASGWKDLLSAQENLAQQAELDLAGLGSAQRRQRVDAALTRAGIARQRRLSFARLSAGQRRRVALARLALGPRPLWLLDEPNTALDADGQTLFAALLDEHLAAGGCAVVASHLPVPARHAGIGLRLEGAPR
ncbi:MAG: cytochrome c biogenesis heme-transporting ATPase CcmA [Betaproteobacteria bacterium]|nr:cytochrome c biogenesis heme-transporting ATPase CcmA [Betaproteobacteria bacterium]